MLNDEGTYRIYDLQGEFQQYSLGAEASETGVLDARIYENGLMAFTGGLNFIEVRGWEGGKTVLLASAGDVTSQVLRTCKLTFLPQV